MDYPKTAAVSNGLLVLTETGSTNQDLLALASKDNSPEFFTLTTEYQSAGRGRLDRRWDAAPRSSVMASVLLRPKFSNPIGIGWLSLMMAEAIRETLSGLGLNPQIKWPNDVLIKGKKISGVLAEASSDLSVVVIGFGINVNQTRQELPTDFATSLLVEETKDLDRDKLLAEILTCFRELYRELSQSGGDAVASGLRAKILAFSATVGELVEVSFPDGSFASGEAVDINESGRLVVSAANETLTVSAGDVLHLRNAKREDK